MVKVQIKAEGLEQAMAFMSDVARNRGIKLRPLMARAGQILLASVMRNFEEEGRPRWKKWSPLTLKIYHGLAREKVESRYKRPATRAKHMRAEMAKIAAGKILSRSGDLKKSIHVGRVTNESVEIGSSLPYARIHQLGGVIRPKTKKALCVPMGGRFLMLKKVTIPARPYLVAQEEDGRAIMRAVRIYILEGR